MFFSSDQSRQQRRLPKKRLALFGAATLAAVLVTVAIPASSDQTTFGAQGGRWGRTVDTDASPYVLQSPRVGAGDQQNQPLHYGVVAWQQLLNGNGADINVDGVYGLKTAAAVESFQSDNGIEATGVVGFPTAKALLAETITDNADAVGMDSSLLTCHLMAESSLDPSAVGLNGSDLGLAQIALPHNPGVTVEEAFDVEFAVRYMAERDKRAFNKYGDWDIAVASYRSPVAADKWATTGTAADDLVTYAHRSTTDCAV